MSNQKSDYELAYGELQHALREHGDAPEFWTICDSIEARLIDAYPRDEVAIIEMVAAWLVHLGVPEQADLQGKV